MNDEPMSDARFDEIVAAKLWSDSHDIGRLRATITAFVTDDRRLRAKVKRLEAEAALSRHILGAMR
jgi:hypothetical protein